MRNDMKDCINDTRSNILIRSFPKIWASSDILQLSCHLSQIVIKFIVVPLKVYLHNSRKTSFSVFHNKKIPKKQKSNHKKIVLKFYI